MFTAVPINGGATPLYHWSVNGVPVVVGTTYTYLPVNGDVVGVTMTSSATCATPRR